MKKKYQNVKDVSPNTYSLLLQTARNYQNANIWIARHYLNSLADKEILTKIPKKKTITTQFENSSKNQLWRVAK